MSVTTLVMTFYHRRIGTTLVDRDLLWRAVVLDRLATEVRRNLSIPFGRQPEVHRGTGLVDRPVQIFPDALHIHVRLVHGRLDPTGRRLARNCSPAQSGMAYLCTTHPHKAVAGESRPEA